MDTGTAKAIEVALAEEDRARTKRRKVAIRRVLRAAAKVTDAHEQGRAEVAAAEAALEQAKERTRQQQEDAAAHAGREVDGALEVFDDRELARFSGLSVSRLRQWRRTARDAAQHDGAQTVVDDAREAAMTSESQPSSSPADVSTVDDVI